MKRTEYGSILGQLQRNPIKCPAADDMARFCPHLSKEQAVEALMAGSGYVACPSLLVRGAFQIVRYYGEWVEAIHVSRVNDGEVDASITGTKNHPPLLSYAHAGRTPRSYADGRRHGDVFTPYTYMDEAMRFAEENWGDELIYDDWDSTVTFYIQDPTDLINDRYHKDYPRTKAILYVTLNCDLNEINNSVSSPGSELFDEAICQMTTDPLIWSELKGGRGGYTRFNCAHCGSGLGLAGCPGCGYRFRDDQSRCGGDDPLSRKMVQYLCDHGLKFGIDPEVAWAKELDKYDEIANQRR